MLYSGNKTRVGATDLLLKSVVSIRLRTLDGRVDKDARDLRPTVVVVVLKK